MEFPQAPACWKRGTCYQAGPQNISCISYLTTQQPFAYLLVTGRSWVATAQEPVNISPLRPNYAGLSPGKWR